MAEKSFTETQHPHAWVWLVLLIAGGWPVALLLQGAPLWPALAPTSICAFLVMLFMPMRTSLAGKTLRVAFGLAPLFIWRFSCEDIVRAEAVTYRPLRTYMGWGMRWGFDGSRALTIRGNRGVMLHLRSGKCCLIGSQQPEALQAALAKQTA